MYQEIFTGTDSLTPRPGHTQQTQVLQATMYVESELHGAGDEARHSSDSTTIAYAYKPERSGLLEPFFDLVPAWLH